jgi:aarF domain-containing kinase
VAEMTLQFSREQNCPDPGRFVADVEELFKSFHKDKRASLHTGECMAELLEEVRRHHVNIDGSVCTVIVTTLVLEVRHTPNLRGGRGRSSGAV